MLNLYSVSHKGRALQGESLAVAESPEQAAELVNEMLKTEVPELAEDPFVYQAHRVGLVNEMPGLALEPQAWFIWDGEY